MGKTSDDIVMGEEAELNEEPTAVTGRISVASFEQKLTDEMSNMVVAYFLFSLVWSVGGNLDESSRTKFDEFFRSLCDMESPSSVYPRYA